MQSWWPQLSETGDEHIFKRRGSRRQLGRNTEGVEEAGAGRGKGAIVRIC